VSAPAPEPATTDVVLAGCPIELLERSRRHNESLMREFAFIAESDEERAELPARLLALVDQARARLVGLNVAVEEQLAAARARGDDTCDLRVTLPSNGRALAVELANLFEAAEEFCRRGDLLTLAESDEPSRFRTWYLDQYVRQLDGEAPTAWPAWRATRV
jgi:hypothetical protein